MDELGRAICLCLAFGLVSGCRVLVSSSFPTLLPSELIPTVIALTVQALEAGGRPGEPTIELTGTPVQPTALPSLTATFPPTPLPQPPTLTPGLAIDNSPTTPSNELPQADIPLATIQIISPGSASRVASPILLRTLLNTGPKGLVRIELFGEDGRLLMREVSVYTESLSKVVSLAKKLEYIISAVAEAGRLQVNVEDEFGRNLAVASVDLVLLSMGEADLNPPGDQAENIVIDLPEANTLIQGGTLRVSGRARLRSEQPLRIELQTSDGKIIGARQVAVAPTPGSSYGTFTVDVPFTIYEPSRVRLLVWEPGDRIPGIVHLSSLEIMLSP